MSIDQMVSSLISQLPNFAGLILCILMQQAIIKILQARILRLEQMNENLVGTLIGKRIEPHPNMPPTPITGL